MMKLDTREENFWIFFCRHRQFHWHSNISIEPSDFARICQRLSFSAGASKLKLFALNEKPRFYLFRVANLQDRGRHTKICNRGY